MRQSEFKRRYDVKTGRYVKKHIYGEGVTDVFKTIGRKLFGKTMKEAANVTGRGSQRQEREGFKDFSKAIYLKLKSISNTATIK